MNRLIEAAQKGTVWNAYLIVGSHLEKVEAVAKEFVAQLSLTPYILEETKMEDIRRMLSDVNIKPDAGQRKVYVLPTDQMSERSQNAILKTLEDPPEYAVFVLLSTNLMIPLPTIKSRCVIYHCQPDGESTIRQELEQRQVIGAQLYDRFSFGSVEQALALSADSAFLDNRNRVVQILSGLLEGRLSPLSKEEKEDAPTYVFYLLLFLRDVIGQPYWFEDQLDLIQRYRQHFTSEQILGMIEKTRETDQLMHKNTNPQYVWDALQVGLMEVIHG